MLSPFAFAVAVAVFLLSLAIGRIVAVSSILSAFAYAAVAIALLGDPWTPEHWPMTVFALLVAALILLRHRSNIRRLLSGNEAKIGERPSNQVAPTLEPHSES